MRDIGVRVRKIRCGGERVYNVEVRRATPTKTMGLNLHIEAEFDFRIFFLLPKHFRNSSGYSHIVTMNVL